MCSGNEVARRITTRATVRLRSITMLPCDVMAAAGVRWSGVVWRAERAVTWSDQQQQQQPCVQVSPPPTTTLLLLWVWQCVQAAVSVEGWEGGILRSPILECKTERERREGQRIWLRHWPLRAPSLPVYCLKSSQLFFTFYSSCWLSAFHFVLASRHFCKLVDGILLIKYISVQYVRKRLPPLSRCYYIPVWTGSVVLCLDVSSVLCCLTMWG